jgi:hypothetical protein
MFGSGGEVVHVGLEMLDGAGLVYRRDVGASVVEGQRADGGVVGLEDCFKSNVNPFHAVNSLLVGAARMRRPTGVRWV